MKIQPSPTYRLQISLPHQEETHRDGAANLEEDVEVYEANPQSRCDTPESYAVFVLQAVSDETFKKSTVPILQLVN